MNKLLIFIFFSFSSYVSAKDIRLMSFFRTNYYTHKTYVFDVSVDSRCNLKGSDPVSSYFEVKKNGKTTIERLSGNNKKLFTPKIISKNSKEALFSLGIFSHELFKTTYSKDVKFKVSTFNTSSGCKAEVESYIDNQLMFDNLERIEAKLQLYRSGFKKGHPKGLTWLKFVEDDGKNCLVGNCQ